MHSIYDFKHYICDSIQSFVKWMTKTLYFMTFMATVENNILHIMFASVTPIGPPEKCKVAAYAVQAVFLDPINVGSLVA